MIIRAFPVCIAMLAFSAPIATSASAQELDEPQSADTVDPQPPARGQTYEPAFFAQFSPRNALEMVARIPGFQISGSGGGGRGLGQANENVLVNGERLASKSDTIADQLQRIPASDVVRIEVVDGTNLDFPGLTGQVANVVVDVDGLSGTFRWRGEVRTTSVDPQWYGGEISVAGSSGRLGYTVSLSNNNNRFGAEGPTTITDGTGALIQVEDTVRTNAFDRPTATANLDYDLGGEANARLNLSYTRVFFNGDTFEAIAGPDLDRSLRSLVSREEGFEYEIGAEVNVPVRSGRLKLIGLERYDEEDGRSTAITTFADTLLVPTGSLFARLDGIGERIGRAEYSFPLWNADWQVSAEAAFNRLDRISALGTLQPGGEFSDIPFPEGSGGVREDRYEFLAGFSRALTPRLSLQLGGGYEFSTIRQTGSAANERSFARPKGEASLAWDAGSGLNVTVALERRVGQLSFGDVLATVFLGDENENTGNNELVPSQTWEARAEVTKALGAWGSTTLFLERRWIEDLVDLVPQVGGGEARGNIDNARRTEIEWTTTLRLDPIGGRGMQLDLRLEYEEGEVIDPVTGLLRDFSGGRDREAELDFRHDIPGTPYAYGFGAEYNRDRPDLRFSEIALGRRTGVSGTLFAEHKDLFGLTVRGGVENVLGSRSRLTRTVFDGPRGPNPVLFVEERDQRIGPIFFLGVSGNF